MPDEVEEMLKEDE
jgi:hypothetical protein